MADLLHPDDSGDDESEETPSDPGDFVLAMSAEDQMEAQLLVSACEEAGIPAILQSPRSGVVGTIASPVDGFNILVPKRDLSRALAVLEERKAALEADPEGAARAAEEEEAAEEVKGT
ncbi:MAG: putative signal transducing protein [Myxococcales bacterium]